MNIKFKLLAFVLAMVMAAAVGVSFDARSADESPRPPVWVGIYTTAGKVGLKWARNPQAARYRVYRSISSGKDYRLIATTTDVSYIDAQVKPGETYYYVLKAQDAKGGESGFSDERYTTIQTAGGGLPVDPPEWVGLLVEPKRVSLSWKPSASSYALAYNVYRSKVSDSGYQLIGSTQDSSFVDTDMVDGETYYYRLTTLDRDFKETGFSETKVVTYVIGEPDRKRRPEGMVTEEVLPKKIVAKPTRLVGFITRGKEEKLLFSPTDVDLDDNGHIFVSDTGSNYIQVYKVENRERKFLRAIGGTGKEAGKFQKLLGIDVDKDGYLYAVDACRGRVQKFDIEGKVLMVKELIKDSKKIIKDLGLKEPIQTFGLVDLKVSDDGSMFVIDNFNHCIVKYSPTGEYIKTFGGFGLEPGKLQAPTFVEFDAEGNLFVSDCLNARIQVFDPDGNYLWGFGEYGNILGSFSRPKGIYIDGSGRIYVADSMTHAIQVFDEGGRFLFLLADERGRQMDLATPNGIVMDDKGQMYIVEKLVNRVQIRQVGISEG